MRLGQLLQKLRQKVLQNLYYYFFGEKITVEFPILGLMPMVLFMMMAGKNFLDILVTIPRDLDHYPLSAHYYKAQSLKRKTASKEKNQKARV